MEYKYIQFSYLCLTTYIYFDILMRFKYFKINFNFKLASLPKVGNLTLDLDRLNINKDYQLDLGCIIF
ncbi:MAG: hypothetical protein KatS3mg094_579 [Candidatus Parcubacteria bacterium]|nr:MAG: hypothetical protein KatS3mg094_579 [Candidatus Parcubacteria bacterium]